MNILLINHYAGSPEMGMEFRPYYFAREWVKAGHRVDIIAADYSHLRRVNPEVDHDFQEDIIDGIHYHWIKTRTYEGNGVKRAITMAQFVSKLWLNTGRIIKEMEPDAVICSSTYPLDTYAGQRIRRKSKKKVKLIHEVHDMWPISPVEIGGMSPKHPFIRVMQAGENSFCRNSDVVVSLLPAAKDYFIEHGMRPEKFIHVPNGIVMDEWEKYEHIPQRLSVHFLDNSAKGKFNLCFFGSINKTYNLDTLINAVKDMGKSDLAVTFIGNGVDKDDLKKLTVGYEETFVFFDPIPKNSIPDLFNYIDAAFVGAKSQQIFRFGICMNKLFDSMMGGKPILYMVDAPNNYVYEYECGLSVEGTTEADLQKALDELMRLDKAKRLDLGSNGKKAAIEVFNYKELADRFLRAIE